MENAEIITLAGGCFWCIETAFNTVQGVHKAESGYMGGARPNPTYEQVCTGVTGHAEVVQVTFDPESITVREVLEIFFSLHDPTQLNRQGADTGTQYRSAVFYHTEAQRERTEEIIKEIEEAGIWPDPVVTQVEAASAYYPAESYHQGYVADNPDNRYCQLVVSPKLAKFKQTFAARLKPESP